MAPHTRGTRLGTSNTMYTAPSVLEVLTSLKWKPDSTPPQVQYSVAGTRKEVCKSAGGGGEQVGRWCQGTEWINVRKWESGDNLGLVTGSLSLVTTLRGQISRDGFTRKDLTCLTRGFILNAMGSYWRLLKRGGGGDGVRFAFRENTEKYHYALIQWLTIEK